MLAVDPDRPAYRKLLWHGDRLTGAMILGPSADIWTTNDVGMLKGLVQSGVALRAVEGAAPAEPFDVEARLRRVSRDPAAPPADGARAAGARRPPCSGADRGQTCSDASRPIGAGPFESEASRPQGAVMTPAATVRGGGEADLPGGYAGTPRVDLSAGRAWGEPWSPDDMRTYLGGAGLGAKILWDEVPGSRRLGRPAEPPRARHRPAGRPAGLGDGRPHGRHPRRHDERRHLDPGQRLLRRQPEVLRLRRHRRPRARRRSGPTSSIRGDRVELRDARHLVGKDTWETQDALNGELGCSGHMLSVYSIGPAGENLVRFAAIQGDYGHVASKNGVGAVMGKKRLKAVAIVRGGHAPPGGRSRAA